jgi:hypothetical protein
LVWVRVWVRCAAIKTKARDARTSDAAASTAFLMSSTRLLSDAAVSFAVLRNVDSGDDDDRQTTGDEGATVWACATVNPLTSVLRGMQTVAC